MKTIKRIVFTGGPCSGKTSFTSRARQVFADRGYRVIIDNESATDLISGGISPATMGMYEFQKYCVALQLKKEELCYKAAQEIDGDKVLIFIDRGLFDDMSYVGEDDFRKIMSEFDIKLEDINDRYDMVVHLVTSAKGKEEAYTYANNAARYETIDEAIIMDDNALKAWESHPNRVIIGNETDFETKLRKAIQSVFEFLGDRKHTQKIKKFFVEVDEEVLNTIKTQKDYSCSHITQNYLMSVDGLERSIRKKDRDGNIEFSYSEANYLSNNERVKTGRVLSQRQYNDMMHEIDKSLYKIDKQRYSFVVDDLFYKLEVHSFDKTKGLLYVDIDDGIEAKVPSFIKVIKEASDDRALKNYNLAKTQKY